MHIRFTHEYHSLTCGVTLLLDRLNHNTHLHYLLPILAQVVLRSELRFLSFWILIPPSQAVPTSVKCCPPVMQQATPWELLERLNVVHGPKGVLDGREARLVNPVLRAAYAVRLFQLLEVIFVFASLYGTQV